jgi:hypothetical protein
MATVGKLLIFLQKDGLKTSIVVDATDSFNSGVPFFQDVSGYNEAVIQVINPSESISFFTTNDDGSVTGQLKPVPNQPINWLLLRGFDLRTGTGVTSVAASANITFNDFAKFIGIFVSTITSTTSTTTTTTPR